jgi:hypothetical protein
VTSLLSSKKYSSAPKYSTKGYAPTAVSAAKCKETNCGFDHFNGVDSQSFKLNCEFIISLDAASIRPLPKASFNYVEIDKSSQGILGKYIP